MFDIGWGELLVIAVVALIVIGPKELPTVLRTLGQYMGKVKRMAHEFQGQFQEALREAELSDLKKQAEDLTGDLKSLADFSDLNPLEETQKEIERAFDAEPNVESEAALSASGEGAESTSAVPSEIAPEKAAETDLPEQAAPVVQETARHEVAHEVAHDELGPVESPPKPAGGAA